jgi:hypothetical protein
LCLFFLFVFDDDNTFMLRAGNVSAFQPEDRRDWVKHLVASAALEEEAAEAEQRAQDAIAEATATYGAGSMAAAAATVAAREESQEMLLDLVPPPMLGTLDRATTMQRLDSSSALITVDETESAVSWRLRLMQLRALHPGAGNVSGTTHIFATLSLFFLEVSSACSCIFSWYLFSSFHPLTHSPTHTRSLQEKAWRWLMSTSYRCSGAFSRCALSWKALSSCRL